MLDGCDLKIEKIEPKLASIDQTTKKSRLAWVRGRKSKGKDQIKLNEEIADLSNKNVIEEDVSDDEIKQQMVASKEK